MFAEKNIFVTTWQLLSFHSKNASVCLFFCSYQRVVATCITISFVHVFLALRLIIPAWKIKEIFKDTKTLKVKTWLNKKLLCWANSVEPVYCSNVYGFDKLFNSFMTEVPIIKRPVHLFAEQINGLVSIW